jgi:hypothetical protein
MNRASPVDLRKAMEMASALTKAGIRFVCMPANSDAEHTSLLIQADQRLEQMAREAEVTHG